MTPVVRLHPPALRLTNIGRHAAEVDALLLEFDYGGTLIDI